MDFLNVSKSFFIIDPRKPSGALTAGFYKKSDVKSALENSIRDKNVQETCRWAIELHISGENNEFWNIIFNSVNKYINIGCPNIYDWLWDKYAEYNRYERWVNKRYLYELRNNQEMRNLIIEVAIICALFPKNNFLNHIPPITESDFQNYNSLPDLSEIYKYAHKNDDAEILLALNEIYTILMLKHKTSAIYWIYWLLKLEALKSKNKQPPLFSQPVLIEDEYYSDWIWNLWIMLMDIAKIMQVDDILHILFKQFRFGYKSGRRKGKMAIICNAILFIKSRRKTPEPILGDYEVYLKALGNVNFMYRSVFNQMVNHPDFPKDISLDDYYTRIKQTKITNKEYRDYVKAFNEKYSVKKLDDEYRNKVFSKIVPEKVRGELSENSVSEELDQSDVFKEVEQQIKFELNCANEENEENCNGGNVKKMIKEDEIPEEIKEIVI